MPSTKMGLSRLEKSIESFKRKVAVSKMLDRGHSWDEIRTEFNLGKTTRKEWIASALWAKRIVKKSKHCILADAYVSGLISHALYRQLCRKWGENVSSIKIKQWREKGFPDLNYGFGAAAQLEMFFAFSDRSPLWDRWPDA